MQEIKLQNSPHLIPRLADDSTTDKLLERLAIRDICIRATVFVRLIERHEPIPSHAMKMAILVAEKAPHLRQRMHAVALSRGRTTLANRFLSASYKAAYSGGSADYELLQARTSGDAAAEVEALHKLFLETNSVDLLYDAAKIADKSLGWRSAFSIYLRIIFIEDPPHSKTILHALRLLDKSGAQKEFLQFGEVCQKLTECEAGKIYWTTKQYFYSGRYLEAIRYIEKNAGIALPYGIAVVLHNTKAVSLERLGRHKEAARAYEAQNKTLSQEKYTYAKYLRTLSEMQVLPKISLPSDPNTDIYIMTGFPRSGTTLLENALAAHQSIATAEETSALSATFDDSFTRLKGNSYVKSEELSSAYSEHRSRYYNRLGLSLQDGKKVGIDKTPILSSMIVYLEKIFPDKRYIFSIRHPYDVVLSNFKQAYAQNNAMAAFNALDTACDLYSYVMTNWFEVFPGETDRVCYVYYDELVTDFEPTVRRVVDFLGVEWDDAVLDFAEHSKKRAVRTPSYANVRKGLSLGVQSSYQNYLFLFDDYCRSKLDPWVEFFGYTVEEPKA